jgi:RNA polymerase sigma-70 factor (ECF subfamily)
MTGALPLSPSPSPSSPPALEGSPASEAAPTSGIDLAALGRGEPAALEAFYRELLDPVYAFVYWRVGGVRSDAEDVTQETFVTALAGIAGFQGRSSLYAWVCGIARNLAHARLRARGRVGDAPGDVPEVVGAERPDQQLEQAETDALVGRALTELPPHYQQSLLDKYVRELSFAEIAAERGGTPKAVESTIQRAKRALGEALGRLGVGRRDGGTHG